MDHFIDEKYIEKVKVNGLMLNIIVTLIAIPVLGLIVLIKLNLLEEKVKWTNYFTLAGLGYFFLCLFGGLIFHEVIKYIIYKSYKINKIKMKIKDHMFFLFTEEKLTIKQAKILWLAPFIILFIIMIIAIILFDFMIAIGLSFLVIVTSDDLIMYLHLLKFNNDDLYIHERDFLGFQVLKRN